MLIAQIEIAELFQDHVTIGCLLRRVIASVQVCRLLQVSLECLLLVGSKIVNLPIDLLAVLSGRMQCQRELVRTCFSCSFHTSPPVAFVEIMVC